MPRSSGETTLAHEVFDLGHLGFGDGEAGPAGRFQVDDELSGVGAREEGQAEAGGDQQGESENRGEARQDLNGAVQRGRNEPVIPAEHGFKAVR